MKTEGNIQHNKDCIEKLRSRLNEYEEDEKMLGGKIDEMGDKVTIDNISIPMIKRTLKAFHAEHDALKTKGKQENGKVKPALYNVEGKGQWEICKNMGRSESAPMLVGRRLKKRPSVQPKSPAPKVPPLRAIVFAAPLRPNGALSGGFGGVAFRAWLKCHKCDGAKRNIWPIHSMFTASPYHSNCFRACLFSLLAFAILRSPT